MNPTPQPQNIAPFTAYQPQPASNFSFNISQPAQLNQAKSPISLNTPQVNPFLLSRNPNQVQATSSISPTSESS